MEDMIKRLENYNSNSEKYKTQKISILINEKKIYKGRKMILYAFKNSIFPMPKQYPSGMDVWGEDDIDSWQCLRKESNMLLSFQRKKKTKKEKPKNIVIMN